MTIEELLRPYALRIFDIDGNGITWMFCSTVEQARTEWCAIAGRSAHQHLSYFLVLEGEAVVYEGSYVTDEC